jgi:hypothetical protein
MPEPSIAGPASNVNHSSSRRAQSWDFATMVGVRTHEVLGEVLRRGGSMSRSEIDQLAAAATERDELVYRLRAAYAGVITGVHAYLARYRPGPPWIFVDSEVALGDAIADYVWVDHTPSPGSDIDRYLVDELKCVTSVRALATRRNLDQYQRLLRGGRARWGDAFAGLRIVAPSVGICVLVQHPVDLLLLGADADLRGDAR